MVIEGASNSKVTISMDAVQTQLVKLLLHFTLRHDGDVSLMMLEQFINEQGLKLNASEIYSLLGDVEVTLDRVSLEGKYLFNAVFAHFLHRDCDHEHEQPAEEPPKKPTLQ
jgi:hypothetical protein